MTIAVIWDVTNHTKNKSDGITAWIQNKSRLDICPTVRKGYQHINLVGKEITLMFIVKAILGTLNVYLDV